MCIYIYIYIYIFISFYRKCTEKEETNNLFVCRKNKTKPASV